MRRLWDTVRWLRPAQVFGRLRHKVWKARLPSVPSVSVRRPENSWVSPSPKPSSFSSDGVPTFLNRSGTLASASDWDNPAVPRLWRYNLHYFDDLLAADAEGRCEFHATLMSRWVAENPAPRGTGWEPYPTSLRIVNWIKWVFAGNELTPDFQQSLALQAAWLEKNIEWHLLGNHLFCNAKALAFAGAFFEGTAADRWLATGMKILHREVPEQILPDGGQFERSPMYHAIALEDMLDISNLAQAFPRLFDKGDIDDWRLVAGKMLRWADTMCHPDDRIALFNDSAFEIAPAVAELREYSARLGVDAPAGSSGTSWLHDSGYVRAEQGDAVLFADVGEIGPDYLPGHAHADTLSFELSLFGCRCVVDTGCSIYEVGEERLRQRGTSAHNTIAVDGQDSSEVWSSFRVARRAKPSNVSVDDGPDSITIAASHDGYTRLPGKVVHSRRFELSQDTLSIHDFLSGSFATAEAHLLLHPAVAVSGDSERLQLTIEGRVVDIMCEGGDLSVEEATWHPEFGKSVATKRINIALTGSGLTTHLSWHH